MWPFQKTSNGNIPTTEGGRDQHEVPRSLFAGTTRLRSQVACFLTKIHDKNHSSPPFTSSKNREVLAAPGKINIEPDNTSLEKEKHLNQTIIFRFYVNLGGCNSSKIRIVSNLVGGWTNPFEKKNSPIGSCPLKNRVEHEKMFVLKPPPSRIISNLQTSKGSCFNSSFPSVQSSLRWPRRQASAARRTVCRDVNRFSKPGADVTNLSRFKVGDFLEMHQLILKNVIIIILIILIIIILIIIIIISSSSISYLAPTWVLPDFFENQTCHWDSFPMVFKFQSIWDHNSFPSSQPTDQPQNETQTARCVSVSVWGSQFSVCLGRMNAHSGKCSVFRI